MVTEKLIDLANQKITILKAKQKTNNEYKETDVGDLIVSDYFLCGSSV
jgi:hypothetical protein